MPDQVEQSRPESSRQYPAFFKWIASQRHREQTENVRTRPPMFGSAHSVHFPYGEEFRPPASRKLLI